MKKYNLSSLFNIMGWCVVGASMLHAMARSGLSAMDSAGLASESYAEVRVLTHEDLPFIPADAEGKCWMSYFESCVTPVISNFIALCREAVDSENEQKATEAIEALVSCSRESCVEKNNESHLRCWAKVAQLNSLRDCVLLLLCEHINRRLAYYEAKIKCICQVKAIEGCSSMWLKEISDYREQIETEKRFFSCAHSTEECATSRCQNLFYNLLRVITKVAWGAADGYVQCCKMNNIAVGDEVIDERKKALDYMLGRISHLGMLTNTLNSINVFRGDAQSEHGAQALFRKKADELEKLITASQQRAHAHKNDPIRRVAKARFARCHALLMRGKTARQQLVKRYRLMT